MDILPRNCLVVVLGLFLFVSAAAAASSTLQGVVNDSSRRPVPNAEVRIEGREGGNSAKVVRTDPSGHYSYNALGEGTYKITLLVNGVVKASIANVNMEIGHVETLNFEILRGAAAKPFASGRHYVWVPSQAGSHLAGSWVEVTEERPMSRGRQERIQNSGSDYVRHIQEAATTIHQ
jgi:hypothetical protein